MTSLCDASSRALALAHRSRARPFTRANARPRRADDDGEDLRSDAVERARAMDRSFIGSTIYLISHSDIRYEGVLVNIDPVESTLTLQNGASFDRAKMGRER
jgi:hypothetical protein